MAIPELGSRVSSVTSDVRPADEPLRDRAPAGTAETETAHAIGAARIFQAALRDAFDAVLGDLVCGLAVDVVARELRLGSVDLAAIASRVIAERLAEEPLRLRVATADAAVCCELPLVVDPTLEPGDAVLECRSGTIDARLGVRLAAVIAAVAE